jgi:predicted RNA-binding protein with RPS1 domain
MATTELATLSLHGTKKGLISISNVTEPYGKGTSDIVSIGISLNGKDIEWKSHIPYENLDEVIEVLQKASEDKKSS